MSDTEVLSDVDSQAGNDVGGIDNPINLIIDDSPVEQEEKTPEQVPTTQDAETTTDTETKSCGICYVDLTLDNSVKTNCNHYFCNTCFFRWIEVNATCPQCRAPIDSNTNLTDDQLDREMSDVYMHYHHLLQRQCALLEAERKKIMDLHKLEDKTNNLMKRQIRVREMIEETEGYNEGYLAAAFEFFHGKNNKYTSPRLGMGRFSEGFMRGFSKGATTESRRLDKLAKKMKKISRRPVKVKTRKVQQTLWECGVVDMDDADPLENVSDETTDTEESSDASNINLEEQFASMTV